MENKETRTIVISLIVIAVLLFVGVKAGLIVGFDNNTDDNYFKSSISLKEGYTKVIQENTSHESKLISSDENIVSIEGDKIVGKKAGKATIKIKQKGKIIGEYEVTVEENNEPVQTEEPAQTEPIIPYEPEKVEEPTKQEPEKPTPTPQPTKPTTSETPKTINVSKVEIINKTESITVGNRILLNYKISPDNATNKSVTWSSSNNNIATVDNGVVTGVRVGTVTITIKTNNGKTDTAKVSVVAKEVPISGISLNKTSASIKIGETILLASNITPSNATNKNVTWSSSNNNVATVSNGTVKGMGSGIAIITAKTSNGMSAMCSVTVSTNEAAVSSISLNKTSTSIEVGKTESLTVTVSPSNATNKTVTWSSSDSSIASVNNGTITALKSGTTTITAQSNNGLKATCKVTVPEAQTNCGASKIHFMNTGSSDAIIIESCGHFGLVDSSNPYNDGTVYSVSNRTESVEHVIDYLKKIIGCGSSCKGKLDFIIATHSHSDHIGGMPRIASVFVNSNTKYYYRQYVRTYEDESTNYDNNGYYLRAYNAMNNAGAKMTEVTGKTPTINFNDLTIKIMNTSKASGDELRNGIAERENYNSIIQLVTHKNGKKVVLSSDMETLDEAKIKSSIGKVDVLKAGHHSYASANSNGYIKTLKADNIIVTNTGFISEGKPRLCYAKRVNSSTKLYLTGKATDAIVLTFTDSSYNIKTQSGGSVTASNPCKGAGWLKDSCWYYYDSSGSTLKGWQELSWSQGKNWFYFKSDGCMLSSTTQLINGVYYHFNSDGVCDSEGC